jgi:hypothetical protein
MYYKIAYVSFSTSETDENNVQMYVFLGNVKSFLNIIKERMNNIPPPEFTSVDDIDMFYKEQPTHLIFSLIFSLQEQEYLQKNNKNSVYFCNTSIYPDDTIETIKYKYINALREKRTFQEGITLPSYEELYMYGKTKREIQPFELYKQLTQNDKLPIYSSQLIQILMNYDVDFDITKIPTDRAITYEDVQRLFPAYSSAIYNAEMKQEQTIYDCLFSIGQNISTNHGNYLYPIQPMDMILIDPFLQKYGTELITTSNQSLLLDEYKLVENVMYMCHAQDIFKQTNTTQMKDQYYSYLIQVYFPFLYRENQNIQNVQDIMKLKETKLDKYTSEYIQKRQDYNEKIDMFYNMYWSKTKPFNYIDKGIQEFKCILHPQTTIPFPLETIFKILHTSVDVPFIRYNQGKKYEKMYRLYTEQIAKNGKKIPYLPKATIFKLMKRIDVGKKVSAYLEVEYKDNELVTILLEFTSSGQIQIHMSFIKPKEKEQVQEIIQMYCNPLIQQVSDYLSQSGYSYPLFNNLYQSNLELILLHYKLKIALDKKFSFKPWVQCISRVFNIIQSNIEDTNDNGALLRFKRVSHYNQMSGQEAFIIEQLNAGRKNSEIVQGLMDNFEFKNEDEAREKIASFISSLQMVQNMHEHKKLRIRENPGFKTQFKMEKFDPYLNIDITDINHIHYIDVLNVYMDSIIRLSQYPETNNVYSLTELNDICKDKKDTTQPTDVVEPEDTMIGDIAHKDIVAPIQAQPLVFDFDVGSKEDKPEVEDEQTLMNIVLGEDEEDDNDKPEPDDKQEQELDDKQEQKVQKEADTDAQEMMFGLLMDDDSDDEEDEEDEEDDKLQLEEGGKIEEKTELKRDITGMNLSNPNPFSERLFEREPSLFLKDNEGGFSAYSRICPWNVRRQPVILTEEEKQKIDRDHKGSYENAVEYKSSSTGEKYYYICPRYWSLKDNVSLTEEQVKSGEYGKVIPSNAKKVPKDATIFEFTSKKHIGKDGEYIGMHPGFLKQDKHPDGKCIPCCFQYWDKPEQIKRRKQCMEGDDKACKEHDAEIKKQQEEQTQMQTQQQPSIPPPEQSINQNVAQDQRRMFEYIKGVDKFPLEQGRFGYLPISLQRFLYIDNKECQLSVQNTNLKKNYPCLLRRGIEANKNQNFISAIAELYSDVNNNELLSIKQMKEYMISKLTLDKFISLHNGNLIELFSPSQEQLQTLPEYKIIQEQLKPYYEKTEYYRRIMIRIEQEQSSSTTTTTTHHIVFENILKKVLYAFYQYIEFLRDENVKIDYQYTWDLICMASSIFKQGINLVILELVNDDITENIQILCPSNAYASVVFDKYKPTALLLKIGNYYEPLLTLEDKKDKFVIQRFFSLQQDKLLPELQLTLETIKNAMNQSCRPLQSMPNIYKFKQNIGLDELYFILTQSSLSSKYHIQTQFMNYQHQVIGILVERFETTNIQSKHKQKYKQHGFIPCSPSAPHQHILQTEWMDTFVGYEYETTRDFLKQLHQDTQEKVPCKPFIKIIEDELIVGILTETNQFIVINPPIQNTIEDELQPIRDLNYMIVDKKVFENNNSQDKERIEYIRRIQLETYFYNAFRNTIRILLNDPMYQSHKEHILTRINKYQNEQEIETEHQNEDDDNKNDENKSMKKYHTLLRVIEKSLREITHPFILFSFYHPNMLFKLTETISQCITNPFKSLYNKDKSTIKNTNVKPYCLLSSNHAKIVLPKYNLIHSKDNEKMYYGRIVDEMIRYTRIRSFLFEPQKYLSLNSIPYQIHNNEIILLQSLLTQDYFDDLIPRDENKYIQQKTTYQLVQPSISQTYSNHIEDTRIRIQDKSKFIETMKEKEQTLSKKEKDVDMDKMDIDVCSQPSLITVTGKWLGIFPTNSKEFIFNDEPPECSFSIIFNILKIHNPSISIRIYELKELLIQEYERIVEHFKTELDIPEITKLLFTILKLQGKQSIIQQADKENQSWRQMIHQPSYYMTNLDLWIIARIFKIPIVLYSGTNLIENSKEFMVIAEQNNGKEGENMIQPKPSSFYFIKSSGITSNKVPKYRLLFAQNQILISPTIMSTKKALGQELNTNTYNYHQYLYNFIQSIKETNVIKEKKLKLKIKKEQKLKLKIVDDKDTENE